MITSVHVYEIRIVLSGYIKYTRGPSGWMPFQSEQVVWLEVHVFSRCDHFKLFSYDLFACRLLLVDYFAL